MAKLDMTIRIAGKEYALPEVTTEAYLNYLDVREPIMAKDGTGALFTRKDFYAMADSLVELWGNQFTREELLSKEGLNPGEIIVRFTSLEGELMNQVNDAMGEITGNFTPTVVSTTN